MHAHHTCPGRSELNELLTGCASFGVMQAMDLYDVSDGYPSTVDALKRIKCPVLVTMSMSIAPYCMCKTVSVFSVNYLYLFRSSQPYLLLRSSYPLLPLPSPLSPSPPLLPLDCGGSVGHSLPRRATARNGATTERVWK